MSVLQMHLASQEEKIQAYKNVHEVWGGGLSLQDHLQRRLNSRQHNRARWYVGCMDGQVVVSLGMYPLEFVVGLETSSNSAVPAQTRIVPGVAVGAVHTIQPFRGRGLASQLLLETEKLECQRGAELSLLYTDVGPAIYARLGYALGTAHEIDLTLPDIPSRAFWANTDAHTQCWQPQQLAAALLTVFPGQSKEQAKAAASGQAALADLEPCHGSRFTQELQQEIIHLHESAKGNTFFSLHRTEDYLRYLFASAEKDLAVCTRDGQNQLTGYARLRPSGTSLKLLDFFDRDRHLRQPLWMLAGWTATALALGCTQISGWLPNLGELPFELPVRSRTLEIPMLKQLAGAWQLDSRAYQACGDLPMIDHV